ncbi:tyrosine-type recombinase/integrase, partial [Xanthovirga aplysinae]|uniref:tyrosine-type recombinase/integrase n=1 Tax=Xanthovirga aplysinae TaxID=2529853 RepID=UPI0012BD75AF
LNPNKFKEHEGHLYLNFSSVKSGKQEKIVLNKKAREIVEKYNFKILVIPQQKCNTYIKWICQAAGIEGEEQGANYVGEQRTVEVIPSWKMMSPHTARRTFARLWADQGGDITKLPKYLGHSSMAITMRYFGCENKEVDNEMLRLFD